jgi:hypothetical protein
VVGDILRIAKSLGVKDKGPQGFGLLVPEAASDGNNHAVDLNPIQI